MLIYEYPNKCLKICSVFGRGTCLMCLWLYLETRMSFRLRTAQSINSSWGSSSGWSLGQTFWPHLLSHSRAEEWWFPEVLEGLTWRTKLFSMKSCVKRKQTVTSFQSPCDYSSPNRVIHLLLASLATSLLLSTAGGLCLLEKF